MSQRSITKQRSPWEQIREADTTMSDIPTDWFTRRVHDGQLLAAVAEEPLGWHVSISFRNHKGEYTRYPSWDELVHAREHLLPAEFGYVMHLPVMEEYVNVHQTTFHLHEFPERTS